MVVRIVVRWHFCCPKLLPFALHFQFGRNSLNQLTFASWRIVGLEMIATSLQHPSILTDCETVADSSSFRRSWGYFGRVCSTVSTRRLAEIGSANCRASRITFLKNCLFWANLGPKMTALLPCFTAS